MLLRKFIIFANTIQSTNQMSSPEMKKLASDRSSNRALEISLIKDRQKLGNILWRTTRKKKYNENRTVAPNIIGIFRKNFGSKNNKPSIKTEHSPQV